MHIFRPTYTLAVYFTAVTAINPMVIAEGSNKLAERSEVEQTSEPLSHVEARQSAQVIKQVLKVWIKIGKSAVKAFQNEVNKQNQAGAGFFRDFSDLTDQLPDPPAGVNQNAAPTKRSPVEKRSANLMTMCKDFASSPTDASNCFSVKIDDGALTAGFKIDSKALSAHLGGGVSAIRIDTPGLICGFANQVKTTTKFAFFNTVGIQHCAGTRMLVQNQLVNLSGDLNDNVQCMGCFKSPGA